MSHQSDQPPVPRAVIHKQILDAAADQPDMAMDALAADIPMATAALVEDVLEEYGDPADEEPEDSFDPDASPMAEDSPSVDLDDLSETQREALRAIAEHPDATQRELGDILGVSAPTVSNRVNAVEGFAWADRQAFVETQFATRGPTIQEETTDQMASTDTESPTETGIETTIDQLAERVATLEQEVEDLPDIAESVSESVLTDPALMHKVVHACLKADTITEDEELQILKALLG